MSDDAVDRDDFLRLVGAVCDDEASTDDFIQLDSIVRDHSGVCDSYFDYCRLHSALMLECHADMATKSVCRQLDMRRNGSVSGDSVPATPNIAAAIIVGSPPVPSTMWQSAVGYVSSGWPLAYSIALVICAIGIAIAAFIYVPISIPTDHELAAETRGGTALQEEDNVVAKITNALNCRFVDPHAKPVNSERVALGDVFALSRGLMEITYDTGVKVILEGPANYEVMSTNGGRLSLGKLTGKIDRTAGKGFSVKTPTATITDLGTEFGVEVARDGETFSHVFQGKVKVQRIDSEGNSHSTVVLKENQSARIRKESAASGIAVEEGSTTTVGFIRSAELQARIRQRQEEAFTRPARVLPLYDRTLVAWVSLDNLDQQGGGVLSLVEMPEFDGIVFGDIEAGKWMAGSPGWCRTEKDQSKHAAETANHHEMVQIAIVYDSTMISIYRNGHPYARYEAGARHVFEKDVLVLMGKRHLDMFFSSLNRVVPVPTLVGAIEEARVYDVALRPEAIASLKPNTPSAVRPLAQWTFEDGTARDSMGYFPMGELRGNARISDGKLILDGGNDSYLLVPSANSDRQTDDNSVSAGRN